MQQQDNENSGTCPVTEVSHVLTHLGDKLDKDDVDSVMLTAPIDSFGGLEYDKFATILGTMVKIPWLNCRRVNSTL